MTHFEDSNRNFHRITILILNSKKFIEKTEKHISTYDNNECDKHSEHFHHHNILLEYYVNIVDDKDLNSMEFHSIVLHNDNIV